MWEASESSRRVWGELQHRADVLGAGTAAMLDILRFVLKEVACESHIPLAKLATRIAHRERSRPASASRAHGSSHPASCDTPKA